MDSEQVKSLIVSVICAWEGKLVIFDESGFTFRV